MTINLQYKTIISTSASLKHPENMLQMKNLFLGEYISSYIEFILTVLWKQLKLLIYCMIV